MARSSYIYIVTSNGKITAGFTVKHELESFLPKVGKGIEVYRVRDNPSDEDKPVKITEEFYQ